MTSKEAIEILTSHNKWRRGEVDYHESPELIGEAIDFAIASMTWDKAYESDNEPIEAKIARTTPTWAGKDADEHLREIRGQDVAPDWIPIVDGGQMPICARACRLALDIDGRILTTDARFWPRQNKWCYGNTLDGVIGKPIAYLPSPAPREYPN